MLSKKALVKQLKYFFNMLFIKLWKTASILVRLRSITSYSKQLNHKQNTVFYSLPSFIYIKLQMSCRSSFIKQYTSYIQFSNLVIRGKGQQFFMVIVFSYQQSIHMYSSLFFFFVKITKAPASNFDSHINPLLVFSLIIFLNNSLSSCDIA